MGELNRIRAGAAPEVEQATSRRREPLSHYLSDEPVEVPWPAFLTSHGRQRADINHTSRDEVIVVLALPLLSFRQRRLSHRLLEPSANGAERLMSPRPGGATARPASSRAFPVAERWKMDCSASFASSLPMTAPKMTTAGHQADHPR